MESGTESVKSQPLWQERTVNELAKLKGWRVPCGTLRVGQEVPVVRETLSW